MLPLTILVKKLYHRCFDRVLNTPLCLQLSEKLQFDGALLPGHYLFIEGSYPRRPGDKARIESFSHPPTKGKCLEFFYHMKGSGIGTLNVWLRRGQKIDSSPMWTLSGNQGDEWFRAMTTITENTQNWKVRKILIQQILFSRNVSGHFSKILYY